MYCQLSNLLSLPRSTSYNMQYQFNKVYKTTVNNRKYHSPFEGQCYRTLRSETSKRGRPNVPCHPSSAGSSQKDINAPIPKELGLPFLEGGMLGSWNRKQESRMTEAKRQGREKPAKIEPWKVQGPEWGTQVEQTALLARSIYIEQVQGEEKRHKKRSQRAGGLPLSLSLFGLTCPHILRIIFLYFLNKTDL